MKIPIFINLTQNEQEKKQLKFYQQQNKEIQMFIGQKNINNFMANKKGKNLTKGLASWPRVLIYLAPVTLAPLQAGSSPYCGSSTSPFLCTWEGSG